MSRFLKWTLLAAAVFAVLAVVFVKVGRKALDDFFYPKPAPMPAVVQTSTEELLVDHFGVDVLGPLS